MRRNRGDLDPTIMDNLNGPNPLQGDLLIKSCRRFEIRRLTGAIVAFGQMIFLTGA